MTIPLVDLRAQYQGIRTEIDRAISGVVERCDFVGGPAVKDFERAFALFCEVPACVGVGNGTDALYLALRALGIGPGDEVITVAHTFIATAEAVRMTGADPIFVDIGGATMLMDPDAVEAAVTVRTRAILPVHLYGHPCDMDGICAIAKRHGLKVVEDAAQAHGARWNGKRVGSFGDAACFSFYPGKNLGAYGDAGAVVSRDPAVVEAVRMLANHGRKEKYTHEIEGVNSRMDTLNAAVLCAKLLHLEEWNRLRQRWAAAYSERLGNRRELRVPSSSPGAESVWHLYVVRAPQRDQLLDALMRSGISGGIHYPVPLHRQPALAHLAASAVSLPATEEAAATVLSLPMYPELDIERIDRICEIVTSSL
jgi:dTDP-4-amino-4,6-dideoxygalactose transaminase